MTRASALGAAAGALSLWACVSCQSSKGRSAAAAPSASAAASVSASAAAVPEPPREAWYVGVWTGTYQSAVHHLALAPKQGGLPEWKVDDPKHGVGSGTLTLAASRDGSVTGTATGPLGREDVHGAFDADTLAARLIPTDDRAVSYAGTIVARRDGERVVGTLTAGSTDGHRARSGTFTLEKGAP